MLWVLGLSSPAALEGVIVNILPNLVALRELKIFS